MSFSPAFPGIDCIDPICPAQIRADVLRLDRIHPVISGNKWYKLRLYTQEAMASGKKIILTKGGAWSNHIVATAFAAREMGLSSAGIIRGEEPAAYSATLQQAADAGMQLFFVSRTDFAGADPSTALPSSFPLHESYFIAEGGYGEKGAEGMATALDGVDLHAYTHLVCAAGTGTMTAGLIKAVLPQQTVISIPVLKGHTGLTKDIQALLTPEENKKAWVILDGYHEGGYAKKTPELLAFMNQFYESTGIPSDFVYTGKLFRAVSTLLKQDYFPAGSRLLIIHSGGLQGNRSLPKGALIFG